MPSPFPGMDPFLENPAIWPGVHGHLIYGAADLLSKQLLPRYVVRPELRIYYSDPADPGRKVLIPDVKIVPGNALRHARRRAGSRKALAAVSVAEPVEATDVQEEEVSETRLLIRNAKSKKIVTILEILGPANKLQSARGRENYLEKRKHVMASDSHFVEIDLLRVGERFGPSEVLREHEYLINVSRIGKRPKGMFWPIRLHQRLPVIPIPLLPGDDDAVLDLQGLLNHVYDNAGYSVDLNYKSEPTPRLGMKWKKWADALLRKKRLR